MSWKALDWATGIRVSSPTMRLIVILLANKADEKVLLLPISRNARDKVLCSAKRSTRNLEEA